MLKKALPPLLAVLFVWILGAVTARAAAGGKPAPDFHVERSAQNLTVDGAYAACEAYNIEGSNYFRLRDLALLLNGTGSQFDVGWDEERREVSIVTERACTAPEGVAPGTGEDLSATAQEGSQTVLIDGAVCDSLTVYNIGGSSFFKLRELADALCFTVDYDPDTNTAAITSWPGSLRFSGEGDSVVSDIRLPAGRFYALCRHEGAGGFIVRFYFDGYGEKFQMLANDSGAYHGAWDMASVRDGVKNGMLEVRADGAWTVEIRRVSGTTTTHIRGTGNVVTGCFTAARNRCAVRIAYTGRRNFIARLVRFGPGSRNDYQLLANVIGDYTGERTVNLEAGARYYLVVRSYGEWTIDLGDGEPVTVYGQEAPEGAENGQAGELNLGMSEKK